MVDRLDHRPTQKQIKIYQYENANAGGIPGFFAVSNTPIDVDARDQEPEDDTEPSGSKLKRAQASTERDLLDLDDLVTALGQDSATAPELVIAIHGYSNSFADVEQWNTEIWEWLAKPENGVPTVPGRVFLGYRWPSEFVLGTKRFSLPNKLFYTFKALPNLLWGVLIIFTLGLVALGAILRILIVPALAMLLLGFSVFMVTLILTLVLLRLTVYFRDTYRALNVAVLDLVEIIRQLDYKLGGPQRVQLHFIGHSLGCSIIANLIRILSDVFDANAVLKKPSPDLGQHLRLGRLVLVAPDIPVEFVIPRQANYLQPALRRFKEAYVFCNEGDLALRLASTAANYIGFPARERKSGYRLGNVSAIRGKTFEYGIVNLKEHSDRKIGFPYDLLEVRASATERYKLSKIVPSNEVTTKKRAVDLFTYFDCTDYRETSNGPGLVSEALRKEALGFWDYARLLVKFVQRSVDKHQGIDTHGGYFHGAFGRRLIYQLGFLGFQGLLSGFEHLQEGTAVPEREQSLLALSHECKMRGIQVVLSPERYKDYVLGEQLDRSGY